MINRLNIFFGISIRGFASPPPLDCLFMRTVSFSRFFFLLKFARSNTLVFLNWGHDFTILADWKEVGPVYFSVSRSGYLSFENGSKLFFQILNTHPHQFLFWDYLPLDHYDDPCCRMAVRTDLLRAPNPLAPL